MAATGFVPFTIPDPQQVLSARSLKKGGVVRLGQPEEHLLAVGQFGMRYFPDEHTSYLRQSDGSIRLWIAGHARTVTFTTDDFKVMRPARLAGANAMPGLGPEHPGSEKFDADYAGGGSVIRASNGRDLLMIYHAENHLFGGVHYSYVPYYATIALARSNDNGLTWRRLGPIITGMAPKAPAHPPRPALGAATPCAIVAGSYIYVYYVDIGLPHSGPDVIHVARAPVVSDGAPGSWRKYYRGSFSEPGLRGRSSPVQGLVAPFNRTISSLFPDVSYNAYLAQYLMLFQTNDGWYCSVSTDLVTWTLEGKIFAFPGGYDFLKPGDTFYSNATMISPDQPSEQLTSHTGYVYYAKGVWKGAGHSLYRRPFTIAY